MRSVTRGSTSKRVFVATHIGATLGKVGGLGSQRSKHLLEDFRSSKFNLGVEDGMVKFDYVTTPKKMGVLRW